MTPILLRPLHDVILWAHRCPDLLLWQEAVRRFDELERLLPRMTDERLADVEEALFRMLPSDWPLWIECCRRRSGADPDMPMLH